jgi:MFS family permease
VLWAVLLLATVPEPPRRATAGGAAPRFAATIGYLWSRKDAFAPMFLANGIKAMLSLGLTVWAPVFFERKFGYAPGAPGPILGMMALVLTPLGLLLGGWWAGRLTAAGRKDANMRVVYLVTMPLIPVAILLPLVSQVWLAFALVGASLFLGSFGSGPANAAIQAVTPGRMRGTTTAIYIAIYNMIGYGLGPLGVGWLNDHVFGEHGIASSMVTLALIAGPLGLFCAWLSLKPYAREIAAAEAAATSSRAAPAPPGKGSAARAATARSRRSPRAARARP